MNGTVEIRLGFLGIVAIVLILLAAFGVVSWWLALIPILITPAIVVVYVIGVTIHEIVREGKKRLRG